MNTEKIPLLRELRVHNASRLDFEKAMGGKVASIDRFDQKIYDMTNSRLSCPPPVQNIQ